MFHEYITVNVYRSIYYIYESIKCLSIYAVAVFYWQLSRNILFELRALNKIEKSKENVANDYRDFCKEVLSQF